MFERDTIPEDVSAKLRPLLANANFDVAKISAASPAAGAFAKWVSALEKYDKARSDTKVWALLWQLTALFACCHRRS